MLRDEVLPKGSNTLLLVGIGLLLVGLAFKVSAAPFQFWSPDVYQGAPTPVTAFMASAAKAAAFIALIRVLLVALPSRADDWRPAIWALAVLSLVVGSVAATVQTDVKRMLAYSSVNHAGFILIGIEAAGHVGNPKQPGRHLGIGRLTCCCTRCSSSARSVSCRSCRAVATDRPISVPSAGCPVRSPCWRWR